MGKGLTFHISDRCRESCAHTHLARCMSNSHIPITNRSLPAVTLWMHELLLDASQPRSDTSEVHGHMSALCTCRTADLRTLRRQEEFTHPSADHRKGFASIRETFDPSGRSGQLRCRRGQQSVSTTGPSPVVHPYSTQHSICIAPVTVERDCSVMTGRP